MTVQGNVFAAIVAAAIALMCTYARSGATMIFFYFLNPFYTVRWLPSAAWAESSRSGWPSQRRTRPSTSTDFTHKMIANWK